MAMYKEFKCKRCGYSDYVSHEGNDTKKSEEVCPQCGGEMEETGMMMMVD